MAFVVFPVRSLPPRFASARRVGSTRTRGAAALDAPALDDANAGDFSSSSGASSPPSPASRYLHPPEVFTSEPGEKVLMQFGESMRVEELPAGTRVAYPGVRANAPSDRATMTAMVEKALDDPIGQPPLREKIRKLVAEKERPKILMAFDDVSIPLPPMRSPDVRQIILEQAERRCVEEGVDERDIQFVCSVALHRFIRDDEFKHVCGEKLFAKYHPTGRMTNYNAVDMEHSVDIGKTEVGEKVVVSKAFAEADLMVYANVNYVAMDGGYKSYATGLAHYETLDQNHDAETLRKTNSLFDPPRSALHRSIDRIGKVMQRHTDVFHVETVLDDNRFPWYLSWVQVLWRRMGWFQKLVAKLSCVLLRVVPHWLRLLLFWGPLVRGQFGLVAVNAGETEAVHAETLRANYEDSVVDVDGQADVLVLAPTCIGPYTKDAYLNPLLVNTYALGYYYNMYVGGVPLLRQGGAMVVVNPMPYKWSSPAHDAYKAIFEEAVAPLGPEGFERMQTRFAEDEKLNDLYRAGLGPAAVHGFYMYTWAAHGMDKVGKVFVVGAEDKRGPDALGWERCDSVVDAVAKARAFLDDPEAKATFWQCPPVGYARVAATSEAERRQIADASACPKERAAAEARAKEASLAASKRAAAETAAKMAAAAQNAEAEALRRQIGAKNNEDATTRDEDATTRDDAAKEATPEKKAPPSKASGGAGAKKRAPEKKKAPVSEGTRVPRALATPARERDGWLGAVTVPPAHLDGVLPGDYGFDPLGLGADPARLAWYQEAELANGRWAMAAVTGIAGAEAFAPDAAPWWAAGAQVARDEHALAVEALLAIQFSTMGVLELKRLRGWLATGQSGVADEYPFDPLALGAADDMKTKEVKHARLGMLAFAGVVAQAVVYRAGPLAALAAHVRDPFAHNIVTEIANLGSTFHAVASNM